MGARLIGIISGASLKVVFQMSVATTPTARLPTQPAVFSANADTVTDNNKYGLSWSGVCVCVENPDGRGRPQQHLQLPVTSKHHIDRSPQTKVNHPGNDLSQPCEMNIRNPPSFFDRAVILVERREESERGPTWTSRRCVKPR